MTRKKSTPPAKKAMFAPMSATPIALGIKKAQRLLRDDEPEEAFMLLTELDEKYPGNESVVRALQEAALAAGIPSAVLSSQKELVRLFPESLAERERLGQIYLADTCPALTVREWRQAVADFPEDAGTPKLREMLAKVEAKLEPLLEGIGLTGDGAFEDACAHEEVRLLLESGKWNEARDGAKALLERRPDFAPARNNLAQAQYVAGDFAGAVETVEAVLAKDPENVHALSNLTRYLFLGGREAEARQVAERLKASTAKGADRTLKVMEPLAYLGDDEGLLAAFRAGYPGVLGDGAAAKKSGGPKPQSEEDAMCWHLAATASARLGDDATANRLWKAAAELATPVYDLAAANLSYQGEPVGERPAPFFFHSREWVSGALMQAFDGLIEAIGEREELAEAIDEAEEEVDEEELTLEFQEVAARAQTLRAELLESHPELSALFPHLLDRAEPQFASFMIGLAEQLEDPTQLAAVRDYGLGQRGPDSERLSALQIAVNRGLLDPGDIRFFRKGEWTQVRLYGFEIDDEADTGGHSEAVLDLLERGAVALEEDNPEEAEALFREALTLEPGAPDIMTNLAYALITAGKGDEANALVDEAFRLHPDDAISRINVAFRLLRAGEVAEAQALIEPLLSRRKFHASEMNSFFRLLTELSLADGKKEDAQNWLTMWMESGMVDENDPAVLDLMFRAIDIEEVMRQSAPRTRAKGERKTSKRRAKE